MARTVFLLWFPLLVGLVPALAQPAHISTKWQRAHQLAQQLQQTPTFDLHAVSCYLDDLFTDPKTQVDFFAEFPEPQSALRQLIRALSYRAKLACDRGNWEQGERAFRLAIRVVRGVLQLKPPDGVPFGRQSDDTGSYVARGLQTHMTTTASAAAFLINERLAQIASTDNRYGRLLQPALRRGREIAALQRRFADRVLPLLKKEDYQQINRIADQHLRDLRSQFDAWEQDIVQSMRRIQALAHENPK
jgi:hypothetical protein